MPLPDGEEPSRRDVVMITAGGFAAVGTAIALWPLLDQMNPDQSALSLATTEVDLSDIEVGQAITVMWRGKPIFIRHGTDEEIAEAKAVPVDDLQTRSPATPISMMPPRRPTRTGPPKAGSPGS